ncbi:hypothetical protein N234_32030 [Ralstonia pickettii DTP0602]|nr:hypothetical protein N234_32030 [Ralstonia pickettii DTP0602]
MQRFKHLFAWCLALMVLAPAGIAQAQSTLSNAQLDQLTAPVALYPDALLSQVLMAATYPADVAAAAQWSRSNPSLSGDAATKAVSNESWDPSVQSLAASGALHRRARQVHPQLCPRWLGARGGALSRSAPAGRFQASPARARCRKRC